MNALLNGLFGLGQPQQPAPVQRGLLGDVLPWVYSKGNQMRGLLADPSGAVQNKVADMNTQAGQFNALTSAAAREGIGAGPYTNKLAGLLADSYNPMGITMYRAGAPKGMTADQGGPTFYASEARGAKPFERYGPITEYDINPKNLLDAQIIRQRALYEQFRQETGNPAGYGQTGRPYWTAEHDFKKWLDNKGHKFDAVMFDEPTGVPSYAVYGR